MKRSSKRLLGVLAASMMVMGLTGCGSSEPNKKVYVYNWGDYIAPEVNERFEEETGIKVVYQEYSDNEVLFTSLDSETINYDIVFPSDYMIEKMINNDMLETVTKAMSPYAISKGESVVDVTNKLLRGTSLEDTLTGIIEAKN